MAVGETAPVLSVRDLTVSLPTDDGVVHAVRGVSFDAWSRRTLAIVGESGSGKSVTALAVLGLLPGTATVAGSVKLRDRELVGLPDRELNTLRGSSIAMVLQDPLTSLNPGMTVGAQIAEGITAHEHGLGRRTVRARVSDLLRKVGIPDPERNAQRYPHQFSGGMRQRVVISMAMANQPDVILADEPTTALDVTVQAQVLEALGEAQQETGAALVLITHDLGVVAGMADQVLVMYAGRPVEVAPAEELYLAPRMPYTVGLLRALPRADSAGRRALIPIEGRPPSLTVVEDGCSFAPRCDLREAICDEVRPDLSVIGSSEHRAACHFRAGVELPSTWHAVDAGVDAGAAAPVGEGAGGDDDADPTPLLEVTGLSKSYGRTRGGLFGRGSVPVRVVKDLDLDVRRNETLAIVGESGCGKSTAMRTILRLTEADAGQITFDGEDVTTVDAKRLRALRRHIQVVFQDPYASLDPRMNVRSIVAEPLKVHGEWDERGRARVDEVLGLVGLDASDGSRYPHEFSGGQRQRVGIARALVLNPRLVVLDEPVSALDVSVQAGVINLLEELKVRLGLSYVFISHDLSVVRHISDRVAVMYLGRIVEVADVETLFERPEHPYTRTLLDAMPIPDPQAERHRPRPRIVGEIPGPDRVPEGCSFHPRCLRFLHDLSETERALCTTEDPALSTRGDHLAACHHVGLGSVLPIRTA